MKKIGILVFYICMDDIQHDNLEEFMMNTISDFDSVVDLDLWNPIYIPVKGINSYIQVIRNDNSLDLDNISQDCLTEIKQVLQKYEKNSDNRSEELLYQTHQD